MIKDTIVKSLGLIRRPQFETNDMVMRGLRVFEWKIIEGQSVFLSEANEEGREYNNNCVLLFWKCAFYIARVKITMAAFKCDKDSLIGIIIYIVNRYEGKYVDSVLEGEGTPANIIGVGNNFNKTE